MNARVGLAVIALAAVACLCGCASQEPRSATPNRSDAATANVDIDKRSGPISETRRRAAIRLQLAIGYYQDQKFSIALDELKETLRVDPNYADAHGVLALVYTELNEKALAEQSFQRALAIEPSNSDLNNNYGWFLCQSGRERDSLVYFENALKNPLYRQPARPLQNAGVCTLKLGDRKLAESYFVRSFELDPTGTVSAMNLAEIFYDRKDYTRARFYVAQVNNSPVPTAASLWLGIRIEHRLGNKTSENALVAQLERGYADSREAQMQRRGAYND